MQWGWLLMVVSPETWWRRRVPGSLPFAPSTSIPLPLRLRGLSECQAICRGLVGPPPPGSADLRTKNMRIAGIASLLMRCAPNPPHFAGSA